MTLFVLARQALREAWREQTWVAIPVYVGIAAVTTRVAGDVAIGAHERAISDTGLFLLWLFTVAAAIFLPTRLIAAPLSDGSAGMWLALPMSRTRWLLGRLLGVWCTLTLLVGGLFLGWLVVAWVRGVEFSAVLPAQAWLLWTEATIVGALATTFSCATRPLVAGWASAAAVVLGHWLAAYRELAATLEGASRFAAMSLTVVIPDLSRFDLGAATSENVPVDTVAVWVASGYGGAWTLTLTLLAVLAVRSREIG